MEDFIQSYIECALWSTPDEDGDLLDASHDSSDIAPDTLAEMTQDCINFVEYVKEVAPNAYKAILRAMSQAGRDFWLTRNGHGAGFWDGEWDDYGDQLTEASKTFGSFDLYVGETGQIYS